MEKVAKDVNGQWHLPSEICLAESRMSLVMLSWLMLLRTRFVSRVSMIESSRALGLVRRIEESRLTNDVLGLNLREWTSLVICTTLQSITQVGWVEELGKCSMWPRKVSSHRQHSIATSIRSAWPPALAF